MKNRKPTIPIIEDKDLKISTPPKEAAGMKAILVSVKHLKEEMNLSGCTNTLFSLNQVGGIDCPGCAWPDPKERSGLGEYCENGAKAIAEEATLKRVDPAFFKKHSVEEMSGWSDFQLGKSGRLTHPMYLPEGATHYEPISWDSAFEKIASKLNELENPNEAIFYTSGRTSNEAAFLYQLFVRQYGTNNMPDCSNMCHESSGSALSETVGIGKGSVTLEDFYISDLILVFGQNPGTNHPRMLSALQKAKKAGAKIITINPIPEAGLIKFKNPQKVGDILGGGTTLTDLFLQVNINGDVPLLKAILYALNEAEKANPGSVFDHEFIKEKTKGLENLLPHLDEINYQEMVEMSGVADQKVKEAVALILGAKKMICCWAMGLTQHENAVDNIREIVNLLLLKGSIGKPGAGTCPVRGHSNVQGDRTMGIWEKPKPAFLEKLGEHFGFRAPMEHGYDVVNAIKAMHKGKGKVFFAMGGNFISATPDTEFTADALRNCSLTVQVSTKLNRSHIVTGKEAIILPCLGRTEKDFQNGKEQFVSVENSMGIVHSSKGTLEPSSPELKSEPAIVAYLAEATLKQTKTNWLELISNYDRIRDGIEAVIPGFDNYNKRVRNDYGFALPNGARTGNFSTPDGKAKFTINALPNKLSEVGKLAMMTIRSHDQFNTTIYGMDDRYRGIKNGRRVIFMSKDDMEERGLKAYDLVNLKSRFKGVSRSVPSFKVVPYDIPKGACATYFPEANPLISIDSVARKSNTPASKLVFIEIEKACV